jgi:hypothetical protein
MKIAAVFKDRQRPNNGMKPTRAFELADYSASHERLMPIVSTFQLALHF